MPPKKGDKPKEKKVAVDKAGSIQSIKCIAS